METELYIELTDTEVHLIFTILKTLVENVMLPPDQAVQVTEILKKFKQKNVTGSKN